MYLPLIVTSTASQLPPPAPTLTITGNPIIDDRTGQPVLADVYVNAALYCQQVTSFTLTVPLTATAEITFTAPGYQPWSLRFRAGGGESKTVTGPIRLAPIE